LVARLGVLLVLGGRERRCSLVCRAAGGQRARGRDAEGDDVQAFVARGKEKKGVGPGRARADEGASELMIRLSRLSPRKKIASRARGLTSSNERPFTAGPTWPPMFGGRGHPDLTAEGRKGVPAEILGVG